MSKPNRLSLLAIAFFTLITLLPAAAQSSPPVASVRPVVDDYFGTKITDPYRWMEDMKSPDFVAWVKAQNDHTNSLLEQIPGRAGLMASITRYDNQRTQVHDLQKYGDRYFYRKLLPGEDNFKLYVRDAKNGQERLLIDPDHFKQPGETQHYAIDYFQPSWDGRYVAYGVSPGGSEQSVLHIYDLQTNHDLAETIDRAQFPQVNWLKDNRSFFYNRLQKLTASDPPTAKYLNSKCYLHQLGEDPAKDVIVLGRGVTPQADIGEADFTFVSYSPASDWLIAFLVHGVQNEFTLYAARMSDLAGPKTPWKKVVGDADDVAGVDLRGNDLYLMTHKDASRYKVVQLDLAHPSFSAAKVVVAPSEAVVRNIRVAHDGLYVQYLDGGIGRLQRVSFDGSKKEDVALPFEGSVGEFFTDPRQAGAIVQTESWVHPQEYLEVAPGKATDLQLIPKPTFDYSQLESVEVKAPAPDGTMIPLSIVYKKGLKKDGMRPTILEGYGSYGITLDPTFATRMIPWMERGGIFGVAHVRGGGEYGEDWHNAGRKLTKQNTIGDFIACGEYLVKQGYTSSSHLAGVGGSAGGITVGGALTQRPDLFGAILDMVGVSDALRAESSPNGPPNVPEFGSTKTEEGFKGLYSMDAYVHVKDGTAYPAVILTTGINDPRVDSWEAAKMTARLQAATSSGKPILLRVDFDAGHGFGSNKTQTNQLQADVQSFALWQFGDPDFQPPKK